MVRSIIFRARICKRCRHHSLLFITLVFVFLRVVGDDRAPARTHSGAFGLTFATIAAQKASVVPRLRDASHDLATQSFAHFTIPYQLL